MPIVGALSVAVTFSTPTDIGLKVDEVVPKGPVSVLFGDIQPPVAAQVTLTPLRGRPKKETEIDMTAVWFSNM
jgi:hypothetical protein